LRAVDVEILGEHALDIGLESGVSLGALRLLFGVRPLRRMIVIA
jgi:hypothetical protein